MSDDFLMCPELQELLNSISNTPLSSSLSSSVIPSNDENELEKLKREYKEFIVKHPTVSNSVYTTETSFIPDHKTVQQRMKAKLLGSNLRVRRG
jgi:SRSO17 transposase